MRFGPRHQHPIGIPKREVPRLLAALSAKRIKAMKRRLEVCEECGTDEAEHEPAGLCSRCFVAERVNAASTGKALRMMACLVEMDQCVKCDELAVRDDLGNGRQPGVQDVRPAGAEGKAAACSNKSSSGSGISAN